MLVAAFILMRPALAADPGIISIYVTPYYQSSGPVIKVGKYSSGLATRNADRFVATVRQMKTQWKSLPFLELYAGAIQLYNRGYRNEATYWFYTAQYQGRLFAMLVDPEKLGTIGSPSFELYHAQEAFFSLCGPDINGYAFGSIALLSAIVQRVQTENRSAGNMRGIYQGIAFASPTRWPAINAELNAGLGKLASQLSSERMQIERERSQNGTQARYGKLTSTPFPGGY